MKMLTFQEIYDYNYRKNADLEDNNNKVNESLESGCKAGKKNDMERNLEKESLLNVKNYSFAQTRAKSQISDSFSVRENSNRTKIEPEILHYMNKLDSLSSNNMISRDTNALEKRYNNETSFITDSIKKSLHSNEPNKFSSNREKVLNKKSDEEMKTGNLFLREIAYSTDIKLLEKNNTDLSDVIKECRRNTFEYLTKAIKKNKTVSKNLSSLAPSRIHEKLEKTDAVFSLKNHPDKTDKKSSSQLSALAPPTSKITADKNTTKINITSHTANTGPLTRSMEDENKSGINSNQNEVVSNKCLENSSGDLKENIKGPSNQSFFIKNLENTQRKSVKCDKTGDKKQIKSSKMLKPNNFQKTERLTNQNELMFLENKESINKKNPHINYVQKKKNELDPKMVCTTDINHVKTAGDSFRGIQNGSNNIQNYSNRERIKKQLSSENIRIANDLNKNVCKVHEVLNKKYASRTEKDLKQEIQSNLILTNVEAKSLTKSCNSLREPKNLNKIMENDMINKVTVVGKNEMENVNIRDIKKETTITRKTSNDHLANTNITTTDVKHIEDTKLIQTDIKNFRNKKIDLSNLNESNDSESIPTGLRRIRGLRIESDKEKGMEQCDSKRSFYAAESNTPKDNERKCIESPLRKDFTKSLTLDKSALTTDCGTASRLNMYLLKHKNQIEAITKDKRIKSIKNKLSNNLRPKDESKIITKQQHSLISLINSGSGKKKSEDNKRDKMKRKEGLNLQSINKKWSIQEPKERTGPARRKILKPENYSNSNLLIESKSNPIKISGEEKKLSSNIVCSENNYKKINRYKKYWYSKADNMEQNLTQDVANLKNEHNNIEPTSSLNCFKKSRKTNKKNNYRDSSLCVSKPKPKIEGFISQSFRPSNSQKRHSSQMYSGTVKNQQAGYSMKNRGKPKSAKCLHKKKSESCVLKSDKNLKNDHKENQSNSPLASSSVLFSQKGLPLHIFQKEQKNLKKGFFLDTPSRQVCGLTPPKQKITKEEPVPKGKVITKLIACTQLKDNVHKQNLKEKKTVKHHSEDNFIDISKIQNMTPEKEFKPTFTEKEKDNTYSQNLDEHQFLKSEAELLKNESNDQHINFVATKDPKLESKLIIDDKPATGGVNATNCPLICSSKNNNNLPSIVGEVVNNVKARIQSFLMADYPKSKLDSGIITKKKKPQEFLLAKEQGSITKHISKERNRLEKIKHSTKQTLCSTLASKSHGTTNEAKLNEKVNKKEMKSENNNKDDSQERKTISDLLGFKPERNKQTCPQMSYSEVLNKFYAGCQT